MSKNSCPFRRSLYRRKVVLGKRVTLLVALTELTRLEFKVQTVEPPFATTSRKRPPPINDRQSKKQTLSLSKPYS